MKATLRKKPILQGRHSLYLDYYPPIPHPETGKLTRREFLNLYVFDKPKTIFDKEHNKGTMELAESIRAQRQLAVQKESYGFLSTKKKHTDFVHYYRDLKEIRGAGRYDTWNNSFLHLEKFTGGTLPFSSLNIKFCNEYRNYLLNAPNLRNREGGTLSQNSAVSYFARFLSTLKQAYRDKLLENDLTQDNELKRISTKPGHRNYLSLEELNILVKTECRYPSIKNAALFSALTGLRFSDIKKLVWAEVQYNKEQGHYLKYTQQKTDEAEVLPISEQAYNLLGKPGAPSESIFSALTDNSTVNLRLKYWLLQAGIKKDISFHCFRHTFATLQLSKGTDIYTVSKMLGHRDLSTTQIYAKIIDEKKREAADKIQLDF